MRYLVILCLMSWSTISAMGQQKKYPIMDISSKDFPFTVGDSVKTNNLFKIHYRFWRQEQQVDIWSGDGITFYGSIVDYIYKLDTRYKKEYKQNGILLKKKIISAAKCNQIVKSYNDLKIGSMPYMGDIPGWDPIKCADALGIETFLSGVYSCRCYWEPQAQSVEQGKRVNKFYDELKAILDLQKSGRDFEMGLPIGEYTIEGRILKRTVKGIKREGLPVIN